MVGSCSVEGVCAAIPFDLEADARVETYKAPPDEAPPVLEWVTSCEARTCRTDTSITGDRVRIYSLTTHQLFMEPGPPPPPLRRPV